LFDIVNKPFGIVQLIAAIGMAHIGAEGHDDIAAPNPRRNTT
jgi:hypothetical protein